MLPVLYITLSFVLGAIGRRTAGGSFQQWTGKDIGDLPVRLFFGATIAAAAWMGGADGQQIAAVIPLTWFGAASGNFHSLPLGRGNTSYLHDFIGLTLHGVISGVLLVIPFVERHWWWPLIAGLTCAPCYEVGYRLDWQRGPGWMTGPTQVAELLFGGLLGIGVYLAP